MRYRANAYCPSCKRPPAVRYYRAAVEGARTLDEDEPIEDVTCTRCGTVYLVSAISLQTATPETGRQRKVLDAEKRAA